MTPAPVEAAMGHQTERKHLSKRRSAAKGAGAVHRPGSADQAATHGGWSGRRKQVVRTAAADGTLAAAAAAAVVAVAGAKAAAAYATARTAKSAARKTRRRVLPGRRRS